MSEEKEITAIALPVNDFTMKDLELIEKFKEKGLIGLAGITEVDVERFMGLYLDGKTYREIAALTKKGKPVILYLANKFKWFELKREYIEELETNLPAKILESKVKDQEFLLHMISAYRKNIGKHADSYFRTDDEAHFNKIDQKDLGVLLKIMEMSHKLNSDSFSHPNDKSLVSLNGMNEGVTITKTGQNSVEITPKVSGFSSKLKAFAEMKREKERENQPAPKVCDIVVDQPQEKKDE